MRERGLRSTNRCPTARKERAGKEVEMIEEKEIERLLEELKSSLQGKIDPYELSKLVEEGRRKR